MTVYGISCCTCRSPNIAPADLPLEWQFHRFLLWQLIFHSYFESSSFGRPGPDRSTPIQWWFHRFLWNSYFIPTLRAQHLADQFLADLPPVKWQFHKFLLYSESSYLADQVLADQPRIIWQFHRLLLWQLIFHSYSESSTFGRPGLGRSTPLIKWQFYRFLLYSESSYLADQVLADLPPHQMAIPQIPVKFIFHSYSESSTFGWPDSCLVLWDLPPGRYTPTSNGNFTDSCSSIPTLRAQHLADQVLADLTPHIRWQFHRLHICSTIK